MKNTLNIIALSVGLLSVAPSVAILNHLPVQSRVLMSSAKSLTLSKVAKAGAMGYAAHKAVQAFCHFRERRAPKIVLQDQYLNQQEQQKKRPLTTLFAHGHGADEHQVDAYTLGADHGNGFVGNGVGCKFLNARTPDGNVSWQHSYLAQDGDIKVLKEEYERIAENMDVAHVGVSRGASTDLSFLGRYQTRSSKSLVAESPFATLTDVLAHLISQNKFGAKLPKLVVNLLSDIAASAAKVVLGGYSPYGVRPIDVVHKIQHDIPVLIVCSKEDQLIPVASSRKLYEAMKQASHPRVHFLELDYGLHANIINDWNGNTYRNVVHAFYKHYNLPHNPDWAEAGQARFAQTQPAIG